jgi:hypothetical protein
VTSAGQFEVFPSKPVPNLALEKMVAVLGLPVSCRNRVNGCKNQEKVDEIEEHEKVCTFR